MLSKHLNLWNVRQHDAARNTLSDLLAELRTSAQARFSGQELDAAYKQLARHGVVTASSRPGGHPQLSDRFMNSLQVCACHAPVDVTIPFDLTG